MIFLLQLQDYALGRNFSTVFENVAELFCGFKNGNLSLGMQQSAWYITIYMVFSITLLGSG